MTITLEITPELEEVLRRRAQRAGLPPDGYILKLLRERLGGGERLPPTYRTKRRNSFSRSTRACHPRRGRAIRR